MFRSLIIQKAPVDRSGSAFAATSYWTAQGGSDPEGSASTGADHEYTP
jgi:hypothetical protein